MMAAVFIKIVGAGEPPKSFCRSASIARGFDEEAPAVGFAASATIDDTAVRRHPSLCSPNEPDVIRRARLTRVLAVHWDSNGSRAECVPFVLLGNPREMAARASSVWRRPDVYHAAAGPERRLEVLTRQNLHI
jgi:hypothetical protein